MSEIGIGREGLGWISMAALESCTRLPIWSSCASLTRLDSAVWFLDACASTIGRLSQIYQVGIAISGPRKETPIISTPDLRWDTCTHVRAIEPVLLSNPYLSLSA